MPPDEGWDRLIRDEERCRRLVLASFDTDEVAALARQGGVELTQRQAERLRRHTGGHPIWVRTLLSELTPAELRAPDGELPAPRSLASAVTARISDLSPAARDLAAALAVINQRGDAHRRRPGRRHRLPDRGARRALQATGFVRYDTGRAGAFRSSSPTPSTGRRSTRTSRPPAAATSTARPPGC